MSRSDKFGLFATVIGLIVDLSALLGFAFGYIRLSPSLGLLANPFALAILTYTLSYFFVGALFYYSIQRAKIGWKRRKKLPNPLSNDVLNKHGMVLWTPIALLWIIGMINYSWKYFYGSKSISVVSETDLTSPVIFIIISLFVGAVFFSLGAELPSIARSLDDFLTPKTRVCMQKRET